VTDELERLATSILRRLRDPEAEFQFQAVVSDAAESVWLSRRGPRLRLQALSAGGGEVGWEESSFRSVDPRRVFQQLAERIQLVSLFSGGPFPEDLMSVFQSDESGPVVRYRAEWPSWSAFEQWLLTEPAPR